jgi:hypothetical protein
MMILMYGRREAVTSRRPSSDLEGRQNHPFGRSAYSDSRISHVYFAYSKIAAQVFNKGLPPAGYDGLGWGGTVTCGDC